MICKKCGAYNPDHATFASLKSAWEAGDTDKAGRYARILARMAEMLAGDELEDSGAFVGDVAALF